MYGISHLLLKIVQSNKNQKLHQVDVFAVLFPLIQHHKPGGLFITVHGKLCKVWGFIGIG